jgi:hypothetical protein
MIARGIIIVILVTALIGGAALYYLQVYAYYEELSAADVGEVQLVRADTGLPETIMTANLRAIDSISSPVRFRACFDTDLDLAALTQTYRLHPDPVPLNAPGWFDCFDAAGLGAALENGEAVGFMGIENVTYGIDRIIAFTPDGRGHAWHQINRCGAVVFDGNPVPDDCPAPPESAN